MDHLTWIHHWSIHAFQEGKHSGPKLLWTGLHLLSSTWLVRIKGPALVPWAALLFPLSLSLRTFCGGRFGLRCDRSFLSLPLLFSYMGSKSIWFRSVDVPFIPNWWSPHSLFYLSGSTHVLQEDKIAVVSCCFRNSPQQLGNGIEHNSATRLTCIQIFCKPSKYSKILLSPVFCEKLSLPSERGPSPHKLRQKPKNSCRFVFGPVNRTGATNYSTMCQWIKASLGSCQWNVKLCSVSPRFLVFSADDSYAWSLPMNFNHSYANSAWNLWRTIGTSIVMFHWS